MADSFDVIAIGSGGGGYRATVPGALRGLRVAVVEESMRGGGRLDRGGVPKKDGYRSARLIEAAGVADGAWFRELRPDLDTGALLGGEIAGTKAGKLTRLRALTPDREAALRLLAAGRYNHLDRRGIAQRHRHPGEQVAAGETGVRMNPAANRAARASARSADAMPEPLRRIVQLLRVIFPVGHTPESPSLGRKLQRDIQ